MKVRNALIALVFAMLTSTALFTTATFAADEEEDDQYFVINDSGVTIKELYVSASEEKNWGKNLLKTAELKDGEGGEILFAHDDERCIWDLATKDEHGNELEWNKIDLCKYTKITLKPNGVAEYK